MLCKSLDVLDLEREACGVCVASEVVEQVAAALHRLVDIKAGNRTRRACSHVAGTGDYHCRAVVHLGEARSHNANHATMPVGVEDDNGTALVKTLKPLDNGVRLLGHGLVKFLARLVHLVYLMTHCYGSLQVVLDEQVDSHLTLLHTTRSIYSWTNLEDDVIDIDLLLVKTTHADDGLEADAGAVIKLLYAMVGKDAVLAHYGHEVRCYAHGNKVEQGVELVGRDAVVHCKGLHELEAYAATREVRIGVGRTGKLGVQYRNGAGQLLIGDVMVAHDEVYAQRLGIRYLLNGLYATVEHDDQLHACGIGVVDTALRDSITILVAVGDVVVYVRRELLQKLIDQSHGRCAVDVIIAIDKYALFLSKSLVQAAHGNIHVVHEERIVKMAELRTEKVPCFGNRSDTPLHKQRTKHRAHFKLGRQPCCQSALLGCKRLIFPILSHYILFLFFLQSVRDI